MKRLMHHVFALTMFALVIGACGGGQSPTSVATQPPAQLPATEPAATGPAATEAPSLVPIDLAGPPMKVGSFYTYVDGAILAAVPGGPFLMGYKNYFDSKEHTVTLSDYWIYTNEVTNDQYALCVDAGQCMAPDPKDNPAFGNYRFVSYPVVGVNYQQSVDYCTFVHGRLPTEAEWEKAARGPDGNLFPWGKNAPVCNLLNFNFCKGKAIDVKSYPDGVSYYGLFDMSGNVREWAADWYKPDYDLDPSLLNDPLGAATGEKRVVRSSGFADSADFTFAAHRFSLIPVNHLPDLGFRCVVEDPTFFAPLCQGLILYGADVNGNPTDDVIPMPDNCQPSSITGTTNCKKTTDNFITPNVAPGATLDPMPGTCAGGPPTWECSGSGTVSIQPQTCVIPPPPNGGTCVPPYVQSADPNDPSKKICTGKGPGKECMPGFNYDPLLQCCSAQNPGPKQYGICAPGFYQQGNTCVPSQANPPQLQVVKFNFAPIALCPGGDTGGCTPTCVPGSYGPVCSGCP